MLRYGGSVTCLPDIKFYHYFYKHLPDICGIRVSGFTTW